MAMAANFRMITSQRSGDVYLSSMSIFFVYLTLGLSILYTLYKVHTTIKPFSFSQQ